MIYIYVFFSSLNEIFTIPVEVFIEWLPTQQNFLNDVKSNLSFVKNELYFYDLLFD